VADVSHRAFRQMMRKPPASCQGVPYNPARPRHPRLALAPGTRLGAYEILSLIGGIPTRELAVGLSASGGEGARDGRFDAL
jgi:hypothetical protein